VDKNKWMLGYLTKEEQAARKKEILQWDFLKDTPKRQFKFLRFGLIDAQREKL
jgi:hypothetical protein